MRKQLLFVDDDPGFLRSIKELFLMAAKGEWEIFTAENHEQGLGMLRQHRMDVIVLDLNLPVMDGLQLLRLLIRTHPGQQIVMLTGHASEESRKECLRNGAALYLEKPQSVDGYSAIFAALDALANAVPQEGFRGLMRRVGLQEVLQLECLGRKSSVLDVCTQTTRGRIFIKDGSIVHAESGSLQGEGALYALLALRGGEFNLLPYSEPAQQTIEGQWEGLLMEAARLFDEGTHESRGIPSGEAAGTATPDAGLAPDEKICIREIVLCSGAGEVLYEWQSTGVDQRLRLFEQVEQQGAQISLLAPVGRFKNLEIRAAGERLFCELRNDIRLFVRSQPASSTA